MTASWTRKKTLALSGGLTMVASLALVAACQPVQYAAGTSPTPPSASSQNSTVYYADGKTVLGTFGATGQQTQAGRDPWAPYLMTQVKNELTALDGVSQRELAAGGAAIVTTISRPLEAGLYQAVSETLSAGSIKGTSGATVASLPPWVLVGAELQDPKNGEVLAEYPGKGQNLPAAECAAVCDVNTAAYARALAGSAFFPYVLAAAVSQGMNVKTSTLNASPELCVPPDSKPTVPSTVVTSGTKQCPEADDMAISDHGGTIIGNPANGGTTVQNALALSSSTAFTDLGHRIGTKNIAGMAEQLGVDVAPYNQGGSGLGNYIGTDGMALGIASLTIQEQATMISAIADNGTYHQAHLIRYWQAQGSAGARQAPKVAVHAVLTPEQDADVQYAMEKTTSDGTAAAAIAFGRQNPGTVIGVTGTTTDSHTGFFAAATSQYSLVVGMFPANPGLRYSLAVLGGGSSGYWPAKIWNTFAMAAFAKTPAPFPASPAFAGRAWNQAGATAR